MRSKWITKQANVKPDMLVLIKEDNMPPQFWKMGRIVKTYTGPDGLVRVAEVFTKGGTYKRPIHKLAPIPGLEE